MSHMTAEHGPWSEGLPTPPELVAVLLDDRQPFGVDWQNSAFNLTDRERLLRLARVKALLPADNAIEEKTTHDVTLENYIRLALQAAGDQRSLDTFLGHVAGVLESEPADVSLLAQQVFWIWAPAAEVAGLYQHKSQLQELAFERLMPEELEAVRQQYDKTLLEGENGLLAQINERIQALLGGQLAGGISFEVSARPKSYYSVWQKLHSEHRDNMELFDLLGFRVIIDGPEADAVEQCYVAMAAVAGEFESEQTRLKDYIVSPKPWGYQSLHLTLYTASGMPFELQVRTRAMHAAAESANALSHQTYEATFKETPGKIIKTSRKIPRLYHWRNEATRLIREQDGVIEGVLGDQILFFRNDGNLYLMNGQGNALDASFRIHSRRALRTRSVYRNGKLIGLTDPVGHGDLIEVKRWPVYPTAAERFDTFGFMVNTNYARKAIEKARRDALSDYLRQRGQERVIERLGNVGLDDPFSVLDQKDRRELADRVGVPSFDKILEMIGVGESSAKLGRVVEWIQARCGVGREVVIKPVPEKRGTLDNEEVLRDLIIPSVGGAPECRVAGCCSEKIKYGDAVLVRPSKQDSALKVHLVDCNNIRDLSDVLFCQWR